MPQIVSARPAAPAPEEATLDPNDLARAVIDKIEDVKGEDIVLMDLRDVTLIADFFVICTGTSDRQLKAIANRIREEVKEEHGVFPHHVEGEPGGGWFLMDYHDVVVHIFSKAMRKYYDLEAAWLEQDAKVLLRIQ